MNSYTAYGLTVQSDIALPDLPTAAAGAQVIVRCAKIEPTCEEEAQTGRFFRKTPAGILLVWPAFGRFLVSRGSEILVEPAAGADESVIRHLLMGPVFSVLNFQRGMAIFHASAVAMPAGGAAFMGGKGFGKSTQAAALLKQGNSLITDDLLTLQVEQDLVRAVPGVPFLKLWPEAITYIGGDPSAHPLVKINLEKRTLNMAAGFVEQPTALRAVFLLDSGPAVELRRLTKREALLRILPHWYGSLFDGDFLPVLGLERQFWDCTALVERVPVYLLRRPSALEHLPEICQAIECAL